MTDYLLDLEYQISMILGDEWAIRFEDLLTIFGGMVLGAILVLIKTAFVLLHFDKKNELKDGEVFLIKTKKQTVTWANAKTFIGGLYAALVTLLFHGWNSRHFIRKRKTMVLIGAIVGLMAISILYVTGVYAFTDFYTYKEQRKKIEAATHSTNQTHPAIATNQNSTQNETKPQNDIKTALEPKNSTPETKHSALKPEHPAKPDRDNHNHDKGNQVQKKAKMEKVKKEIEDLLEEEEKQGLDKETKEAIRKEIEKDFQELNAQGLDVQVKTPVVNVKVKTQGVNTVEPISTLPEVNLHHELRLHP